MKKKDLISRTAEILRKSNIRKPISMPKQVFHISDEEGNHKEFVIRKTDKTVMYNANDVAAIIDACMLAIEDAVKHGEEVYIHNFGTLSVNKRAATAVKRLDTGEKMSIAEHYVPKFTCGKSLRLAAKLYGLSLKDSKEPFPEYSDVPNGEVYE